MQNSDYIKPNYYRSRTGMWADTVIHDFDLNFRLGNAFKYIVRAGKKEDARKDLEKAIEYLKMELECYESTVQ